MRLNQSDRLKQLPVYLFAEIDKLKSQVKARGVDIISFGIGDPDLPTPKAIVDVLKKESEIDANQKYPSYEGLLKFRESVSNWYKKRFNITLDPETEVLSLIGSKEGIGHLPLAFVNPGDVVLIPDPGYPVYRAGTIFAGGIPYIMPLKEENDFLPDFSIIPNDILKKAKLMFLNYPNNPTSASADRHFFNEVVKFAKTNEIIVAHDFAYSEVYTGEKGNDSFLEANGAKEIGIEFHSLSKTFNMTGFRIGFAAGNEEIIKGLGAVKTNLDSGVFQAIQLAGAYGLDNELKAVEDNNKIYKKRRELLVSGLEKLGYKVYKSDATFYVWAHVPKTGMTSKDFAVSLLNETGIIVTPGSGFGENGEGFVRFSLTISENRIKEALVRMGA
ncbi:MAG: LL-diaminopimelate aminotransferase [Candidatus Acidulodesulfobacterium acidiphilum]|uniref:Aminotransferase n=1 Tax=Candidatus Acidulodesulfobacterium acidiphilum TaxID=2597224 RepID=A0A520XFV9_9DELT|nr:MAG: LL-diaminopimelate aminotransferase [Candidatus Acidulodesulfobacterium acidiphilum]